MNDIIYSGDMVKEHIKEANKGLYLDKYFLYRGYRYSHAEAVIKAKEYMKSVHLIR